jgi:flagellar biosynthesis/type III secretory pathway ATPase
VAGTNPVVDRSIVLRPAIDAFLRQSTTESSDLDSTREALIRLVETPVAAS